ncbi:hypothetical protein J3459_017525 [Metarhizium acridum]|uniref:Uncharacterized protein n=1 Tax=Metarhizium acridum (strain CQMa 102) TaxID=655827 RepID=E9ECX1_METAQ|nr:uncharacterized protein MAC_07719 [Metarhizium acridum CQMa 102]EFY86265.1 hypothetical protein MAC_07719 [Metarhizium acridum CQMa 102]KAG8409422.1 hypothetical protein J3459_017525 [Metarhizium acridum]
MKLLGLSILAPAVCQALSHFEWSFPSLPPSRTLDDVTFPVSLAKAQHTKQYFLAYQFTFGTQNSTQKTLGHMGYIGLQPQPDVEGRSRIRAVFSSFASDTNSSHPNCHAGADTDSPEPPTGMSCAVVYEGHYPHAYNLAVRKKYPYCTGRVECHTWAGSVIDTVTKKAIEIGVWTLPHENYDGIEANTGFIQDFVGKPSCADMPRSEIYIKFPITSTPGAGHGLIQRPYQQQTKCKDQNHFKPTEIGGGWDIKWGWK